MVMCGTNKTGSSEGELSVLDLLLQQDNFGKTVDDDGIGDFGLTYELLDYSKPPLAQTPDGTCTNETDEQKEDRQREIEEMEEDGGADVEGEVEEEVIEVIRGCTNPKATNYNSKATEDDGSCILPPPEEEEKEPVTDPDLKQYKDFLTPRSKETALKEAKTYLGTTYYVPTKFDGHYDGDNSGKNRWGGGPLNMQLMGEMVGYYDSPGDGSEGYFKWHELLNRHNTKYWVPEPRPFYIATKYWRNGGYDDRARQQGKLVGCNQKVVKDGMYTAGLCPEVDELVIHTTGIKNCHNRNADPIRHATGLMRFLGYSSLPYHWMLTANGYCSQMLPDWKYGTGVGGMKSNKSDTKNIGITWMTYDDPVGHGGYPDLPGLKGKAMTIAESGGFNGKYRNAWPSNEQIINMAKLVAIYVKRYPNIVITGHHQFKVKHCPNFWVPAWIRAGGIPGLDQTDIDKLVRTGGPHGDDEGYAFAKDCTSKKYAVELLVQAGEELAKISNPGGVGTGATPRPPDADQNNPVNPNQSMLKRWQDMNCDEFVPWFNQNIKPMNSSIRTGFMMGLSPEDQDLLVEKTRDCSV